MAASRWFRWFVPLAIIAVLVGGCAPTVEGMLEEGDVQGLVEALDSEATAQFRADAAVALGALADEDAVAPLISALAGDPDAIVRAGAAAALGSFAMEDAIVPLLRALADDAAEVREAADAALDAVMSRAPVARVVASLVVALEDADAAVRQTAATFLGTIGNDAALIPLLRALGDDAAAVRDTAEVALDALVGRIPAESALASLQQAIEDADPAVQLGAIALLARVGDSDSVLPLLEAGASEADEVRDAADGALTELLRAMPDAAAVGALLEAAGDSRPAIASAADAVLRAYLVELGPVPAAEAILAVDAGDAWLATALAVEESELAAETVRLGLQLDPLSDIWNAVAVVADGTPVEGTRAYTESDAFHPIVDLSGMLGIEGWQPTALRFTELVAVVDEIQWTQLEECLYNGPSIFRYRGSQTVRVLAVADGSVIAEQTFVGTDPRACQAWEDYWLTELYGDDPDLTAATEWLASIVNPPEE